MNSSARMHMPHKNEKISVRIVALSLFIYGYRVTLDNSRFSKSDLT